MTASNSVRVADPGPSVQRPKQTQRRIDVVIVGAGDETLIEVGPVLGDQYRTYSADSPADIAAVAPASWIGLFDGTTVPDARSAFAQLEQQYSGQAWIVLSTDAERAAWQPVLSRGSACAVIARGELSAESLTTALESAQRRLASGRPSATPPQRLGLRKQMPWIVGGAVAAAVAVGGWWLSHGHTQPAVTASVGHPQPNAARGAAPSPAAVIAPAATVPASVEDLLSMARIAFRDPTTQLPKADAPLQGNSALELYGAVLDQQPKNQEALEGVRRLQSVTRLRVQSALQSGDVDSAARLLSVLQHSSIAPDELRDLAAAVTAARPKQLAAQARSAMVAGNLTSARQIIDQLAALSGERSPVPELRKELDARNLDTALAASAQQVRAALAAGSLLEPAADNARTRFVAMRELSRTSSQTLAVEHELLAALMRRARAAITRQDFEGAQQVLAAAQDIGTPADTADTRAALDAAVTAKRVAEEASVAAAKVARASAPSPAAAAAGIILSPKTTRPLQVEFPRTALALNAQGYVLVEFTLNPNGSASALTVVESSPKGTFDSSALSAVKQASFVTRDLVDPQRAQRARIKISFNLADAGAPAPATTRSAGTAAPAATTDGAAAPLIVSSHPMRPLQVDYPDSALAMRREGFVVVEFMLNPDGSASSAVVVDSNPSKLFDREALKALQGTRFQTKDLSDPSKPQRARLKINFKLP